VNHLVSSPNVAEAERYLPLSESMVELSGAATPISPGVWVLHTSDEPLYSHSLADRGQGIERIAESGNIQPLADALKEKLPPGANATGTFTTPVGADKPGAAAPGKAFEFTVTAKPGDQLSFATMFGWSNDWFFGSAAGSISLFGRDNKPVNGDVTSDVNIYDAGTELNEEVAIGPDTGPQQSMPDQGPADPIKQVRPLSTADYARTASAHLRVTVTSM
jgi:hypothetical protein